MNGAMNPQIVPKGAPVGGVVVEAHRRGHFKGGSVLQLRLTSLTLNGTEYRLATRDYERTKKGKGRRSAGLIGGGAGTVAAGTTGNRDLDIPAESVVNFTLAEDLVVDLPESSGTVQ